MKKQVESESLCKMTLFNDFEFISGLDWYCESSRHNTALEIIPVSTNFLWYSEVCYSHTGERLVIEYVKLIMLVMTIETASVYTAGHALLYCFSDPSEVKCQIFLLKRSEFVQFRTTIFPSLTWSRSFGSLICFLMSQLHSSIHIFDETTDVKFDNVFETNIISFLMSLQKFLRYAKWTSSYFISSRCWGYKLFDIERSQESLCVCFGSMINFASKLTQFTNFFENVLFGQISVKNVMLFKWFSVFFL